MILPEPPMLMQTNKKKNDKQPRKKSHIIKIHIKRKKNQDDTTKS